MVCGSRGAVKPLTETVSSKDRAQFLQEAAILCQFDHENVQASWCSDRWMCTVPEYVPNGDPSSVLLQLRE